MANRAPPKPLNGKAEEAETAQESTVRPPTPPLHRTASARGVVVPAFSTFRPREVKPSPTNPVAHVAWSCDGRRLASVGTDKTVRLWSPEKNLEMRHAQGFHNGHDHDTDYVAWNPSHPELFCSSSQRDRRIVFWDARQGRHVQSYVHSAPPSQLVYHPGGKILGVITTHHQLFFLELGQVEGGKTQWTTMKHDPVNASSVLFNHTGTGLVLSHWRSNTLMVTDFPGNTQRGMPAAHVGGCIALALDPRGRFLASGGYDSIVNLFDASELICVNTITSCDHSINTIDFSSDGEYLAIGSDGSYIEICSTETAIPIHRLITPGPCSTVQWHPSRYLFAYCGRTKYRDSTAQPTGYLGLFDPGA